MLRAKFQLWSDSPYSRLKAARKLNPKQKSQFSEKLTTTAPKGKWPFGMPTSVNPWLLVMGISPGGGEHESNYGLPPTIGSVHSGFGGKHGDWDKEKPSSFWRKVRQLCFGLVKSIDSRLKDEVSCLAVSGLLNLGTKNQGQGNFDATNLKIVKWIPQVLEILKPRVIVLLGWKSLFPNLRECWAETCFPGEVVHRKADWQIPLKAESKRHYSFRIWEISTSWGNMTVVLWPNHPSQCPFAKNEENWKKSIKQASLLLKKRK